MIGFADSVPFTMAPNVNDYTKGIYTIVGMLTYSKQILGIEYRINQNMGPQVHVVEGQTKIDNKKIIRHEFTLQGIRDIQYKSNIFATNIIVQANRLSLFEKVHGVQNERLILKIVRKERGHARSLVSTVKADLSEERLSRLSED